MKKFLKILYKIFLVIPLVIGVISYYRLGESLSDALYYSIHLYGFSFEKPEQFNIWLEIVKWLAPLMTATSIAIAVRSVFDYVRVHFMAIKKSGNVLYGDSEYARILCENEKNAVLCATAPISYAKNHFIMYDSDRKGFLFCQKYMSSLKQKNVYLCVREMDASLIKADAQIKLFNPYDVIAGRFWKECQLWSASKMEYKIAIMGFGNLGKRILEKALQLNLFSVNQKLEYYVFGNSHCFQAAHSFMDLMNQDRILYYEKDCEEQWNLLKSMDMIILTEEAELDLIQNVLCCSSSSCKVYYYSPEEGLGDFIATDRLFPYGISKKVFTLENIKTDALYQNAINLNRQYVKKYHGPEWEQLSGFFKDSNISAADYGEVIRILSMKGLPELELAELEHIRWCRFYFLRYWKYGVPANGTKKDEKEKLHQCLVPFADLDENERKKDIEVVQMWRKEQEENKGTQL